MTSLPAIRDPMHPWLALMLSPIHLIMLIVPVLTEIHPCKRIHGQRSNDRPC